MACLGGWRRLRRQSSLTFGVASFCLTAKPRPLPAHSVVVARLEIMAFGAAYLLCDWASQSARGPLAASRLPFPAMTPSTGNRSPAPANRWLITKRSLPRALHLPNLTTLYKAERPPVGNEPQTEPALCHLPSHRVKSPCYEHVRMQRKITLSERAAAAMTCDCPREAR